MERLVRALSVRQPLAELIITGEKTIEFRSRRTLIRERVYVYASKTLAEVEGFAQAEAELLPRGVIVGSVEITDCLTDELGAGYILERPRRYRQPLKPLAVPQPGPGFWRPKF